MNRRDVFGVTIAASAGLVLGRRAAAATALRIATIPIDPGAQVVYALDRGSFNRNLLTPEVQYINNGAAIISAVVGGGVDIGYANVISLAVAHAHGFTLTVAAPAGLYTSKAPTSVLMVRKDSTIRAARDCYAKTIGVSSLKSITQYSTQAWLDKNGGDSKSVRFIELSFPEIAPALVSRRIDVGHFAEPFISDAKNVARVLGDSYDAVGSKFLISVFVATRAYVAANAATIKYFADAMSETAIWANSHHAESGVMLANVAKLDITVVNGMTRSTYADRLTAESLQPSIDVAAHYGGLTAFPAAEFMP